MVYLGKIYETVNMPLLGSLLVVIALLCLVLIMQSRALTATDASKKDKLAKDIEKSTYIFIIPTGSAMVIAGFILWDLLSASFIPVGFTLIAASVTFLVQSKSLSVSGDKAIRFGRYIKVLAWVLFAVTILGLVFLLLPLIKMALTCLVALIHWALMLL